MFLDEEDVRKRLRYEPLISAMKQALIDFSVGKAVQPLRARLPVPQQQAHFLVMPAIYGDVMGVKMITFSANNAERGLPSHFATIELFRCDTGEPLAVMDGTLITEMRTAAVSAIATDLLAKKDARVLAILGSGVQARSHLEALQHVRSFKEIRVWSRNPEHARSFAQQTGAKAMPAEEAVRDADVIVTVTGSAEPVLQGEWLKEGAHVNAVGAVGSNKRELDDEAMRALLVVESRDAAAKESAEIRLSGAAIDAELGELLAGKKLLRQAKRTVFKSVGMAVEDIAAAKLVYDAAQQK